MTQVKRYWWSLRCSLIGSWIAASLVAGLVMWAALNAPPIFAMMMNDGSRVARAEIYTMLLIAGWCVQGVVFFLLVNVRAMLVVFDELRRDL